jgi:hypothetical protein
VTDPDAVVCEQVVAAPRGGPVAIDTRAVIDVARPRELVAA